MAKLLAFLAATAFSNTIRDPTVSVVGGNDVPSAQTFPFMLLNEPCFDVGCVKCGASLIAPTTALSAANCFFLGTGSLRLSATSVTLYQNILTLNGPGSSNSRSYCRSLGYPYLESGFRSYSIYDCEKQTMPAENIFVHEDYDYTTHKNDIAVIKLKKEFTFAPDSYPSLPIVPPAAGDKHIVLGWGTTTDGGEPSNILQSASIPVLGQSTCASQVPIFTKDMQYCAGYTEGGVDFCEGDAGGPFFDIYNNQVIMYGIASYGYGC